MSAYEIKMWFQEYRRKKMWTESCTRFWWEKTQRKGPLGRPRCRWKDGIRMDLGETGWTCVDWIQLAQDRDQCQTLVNTVINLWVLTP
jgi:hypothetical protein